MTPEIKEKYEELKLFTDSMTGILLCFDEESFSEWEREANKYADGTMGIIACHFMSMRDVQTTERNLTNAIKISRLLRELKAALIESGGGNAKG